MSINLAIQFDHPDAVSQFVQYARIDNLAPGAAPVFTTVSPNPVISPAVIATNIPAGQYQINYTPVYADGRSCPMQSVLTPGCDGLISINAVVSGSVIIINYLAPPTAPKVRLTVLYPNGGNFTANYVNDGNPVSIGIPAGVFGNYTVSGQSVCDESSGFYSTPSGSVTVAVAQPDTFVQVGTTNTGPGGTRTQIFQTGATVTAGATYNLAVYSVNVAVRAVAGDTPASICTKMAAAINGTSAISWDANGSAPTSGTPGFPPTATASGNQVTTVLNYQNQFSSSVS